MERTNASTHGVSAWTTRTTSTLPHGRVSLCAWTIVLGAAGAAHASGARTLDHSYWFASVVHEYAPAPGQFLNQPGGEGLFFNDPTRALGPPIGGGTLSPNNTKLVTLGGFGGSIVLGFSETVVDDPCNPLGMDAIVFSNAFWVDGHPNRRWAEGAVIEISRDDNGNGIPDDPWYVVRGSSLPAQPIAAHRVQPWDNDPGTTTPPANVGWYPAPPHFPGFPSSYTTSGYELPAPFTQPILTNPNGLSATVEGHWGFAGLSPTLLRGDMSGATGSGTHDNRLDQPEDAPGIDAALFYTAPDDPMTVGVRAGSGGGDAFDIAWAVEPSTGDPANLDGFDFIRIRTGVDALVGPGGILGEMSTEIGAVARVRPRHFLRGDANDDGVVDFTDFSIVLSNYGQSGPVGELQGDVNCDGVVDFTDFSIVLSNYGASAR